MFDARNARGDDERGEEVIKRKKKRRISRHAVTTHETRSLRVIAPELVCTWYVASRLPRIHDDHHRPWGDLSHSTVGFVLRRRFDPRKAWDLLSTIVLMNRFCLLGGDNSTKSRFQCPVTGGCMDHGPWRLEKECGCLSPTWASFILVFTWSKSSVGVQSKDRAGLRGGNVALGGGRHPWKPPGRSCTCLVPPKMVDGCQPHWGWTALWR